jgi:hypothetical protein
MHTKSLDFVCRRESTATTSSSIQLLSSRLIGAQKNGVQRVREGLPEPLRQTLATGARSWMRRSGGLSRLSDAPRDLHGLRCEERETGLSVRQHEIHVAVCHADWRFVSRHDDQGCGATDASRLARRLRNSIRSTCVSSSRVAGIRLRTSSAFVDQEAACVPDHRQRSGTETRDMVRRERP